MSRNGQSPTITPQAAYTPTSNRAGSRSLRIQLRRCRFYVTLDGYVKPCLFHKIKPKKRRQTWIQQLLSTPWLITVSC
ncbi:ATP-dependent nuclease subunit B [Lacticaseibacillus rhamnosus]|nr:ATP-dependent nuclease subunit B [Lacticaseibacillus rhamnosus]MBB6656162.1 ATP-dependent nuclease subunit B [Lacticaseibacillus rhamnosus]MCT3145083.1 ATP-dependent nuclease subunit B [Lacticaseibacillus rhamnosus]MCT3153413.1 ATP-dependent nuclease subunit B [Lacticaseibacillus rhamnosus]MCT3162926.1 ATP-dependent nuclease subunit B [Lacticaseibacillus rhamnosus]